MENEDLILQETLKEMASIAIEFKKNKENVDNLTNKCESIAHSLNCSINLINPNPKAQLDELSASINSFIKKSKEEVKLIENSINSINSNIQNDKNRKLQFKEKIHEFRESELTKLFLRDKEIRSFFFLVLTLLFTFSIWLLVNSYHRTGKIFDFAFWTHSVWTGVPKAFQIDFILFLYSIIIVIYVQFIKFIFNKTGKLHYFSIIIIYCLIIINVPIISLNLFSKTKHSLPAGIIVGAEMTRNMLKMHAYFREKILYGFKDYHPQYAYFTPYTKKDGQEMVKPEIPEITIESFTKEMKRFFYYYFCPSLVYRDTYPRLPKIRKFMLTFHILTFLLCFYFLYVFVTYNCSPFFGIKKIKDYYSLTQFVSDSIRLSLPSSIALSVAFFLILHSWMNIFAELLRHGDRKFYEDWWNCTNFEEYYRKWNMVVHEWLYYYLYNDLRRFSLGKMSKLVSKFLVFFISVCLHEVILTMGLGFCYPVLSFFFGGPGVLFTFIKTKGMFYNFIFWMELLFGPGLIIVLYIWEFNLREAFEHVELERKRDRYMPKIILMFYREYKEKLMQVIE